MGPLVFFRPLMLALFAMLLADGIYAHPLDRWSQRFAVTNSLAGFADVAWGDERFVAVGAELVATSTNGSDWFLQDSGLTGFLRTVAHGNGRFVTAGLNGVVASSPDGTNWTEHIPGTNSNHHLFDLTYGNGLFVAVGQAGRILISSNGADWSQQQSGTPFNLFDVAYGAGIFLVSLSPGTNLLSIDGINWVRHPSGTSNNLYTIGFGGSHFLAVDTRHHVWMSSDGTNWTARGSITGIRPPTLGWGNGHFVILANSTLEYSGGAGPWMVSATNLTASGIAFANGTFVLVAGGRLYQSDPVVHLQIAGPATFDLAGPRGFYTIEAADDSSAPPLWQSLTNVLVTNSPTRWSDVQASNAPVRFYRAVLAP
jgi:hypothetical protein